MNNEQPKGPDVVMDWQMVESAHDSKTVDATRKDTREKIIEGVPLN